MEYIKYFLLFIMYDSWSQANPVPNTLDELTLNINIENNRNHKRNPAAKYARPEDYLEESKQSMINAGGQSQVIPGSQAGGQSQVIPGSQAGGQSQVIPGSQAGGQSQVIPGSQAAKSCQPNQFRCDDGYCIPLEQKCNKYGNCEDRSDEKKSLCDKSCPEHRCDDGHCIRNFRKCDGYNDCQDESDEKRSICEKIQQVQGQGIPSLTGQSIPGQQVQGQGQQQVLPFPTGPGQQQLPPLSTGQQVQGQGQGTLEDPTSKISKLVGEKSISNRDKGMREKPRPTPGEVKAQTNYDKGILKKLNEHNRDKYDDPDENDTDEDDTDKDGDKENTINLNIEEK